jgi:hypothetical protein
MTATIQFSAEDDLFFQNNVEQLLPGFGSSYVDTASSSSETVGPFDDDAFSASMNGGKDDCELLFELDNFVNLLNPNNEDCGIAELNTNLYDSDTTATSSVASGGSSNTDRSGMSNNASRVSTNEGPNRASILGKRTGAPLPSPARATAAPGISYVTTTKKSKTNTKPAARLSSVVKLERRPSVVAVRAPLPATSSQQQKAGFVCNIAGCNCQTLNKPKTKPQFVAKPSPPSARQPLTPVARSNTVTRSVPLPTPNSAALQSSAFRGVSCCGRDRKWQARIRDRTVNRVRYLGRFSSQLDAAFEYDKHARAYKGSGAMTNFIAVTLEQKELLSSTYASLGYLPRNLFFLLGEGMETRMSAVLEQNLKRSKESNVNGGKTKTMPSSPYRPGVSPKNVVRGAWAPKGRHVSSALSRSVFTA